MLENQQQGGSARVVKQTQRMLQQEPPNLQIPIMIRCHTVAECSSLYTA